MAKKHGLDRISDLGDDILCHILSLLLIKDAVQTSALSSRWRYLFAFMPSLTLDFWYPGRRKKFKRFVDRLLDSPDQLDLECIRVTGLSWDDDSSRLYRWISNALSRCVKEIVIHSHTRLMLPPLLFTCDSLVTLDLDFYDGLKFPSDVCLPNLTTLNLRNLKICGYMEAPTNFCLPNLKTLNLWRIVLSDVSAIEELISTCDVLEKLHMELAGWSDDTSKLSIYNLSLKELILDVGKRWVRDDVDECVVVTNTPNLVLFKYVGVLPEGHRFNSLVETRRPVFAFHKLVRLEIVNTCAHWQEKWVIKFLHAAPNLQQLLFTQEFSPPHHHEIEALPEE